jgi:hypothetical protein
VRSPRRRSTTARAALGLGALSLLTTGVDHVQQYYSADYSTVPTIGTLFFFNFVAAVIVAVGLVAPLGRVAGMPSEPCSLWRDRDSRPLARRVVRLGVVRAPRLRRARLSDADRAGDRGGGRHHRLPRDLPRRERHGPSKDPQQVHPEMTIEQRRRHYEPCFIPRADDLCGPAPRDAA